MPLYDVIVWINIAFTEDQHLLRPHCLFSPAHRFVDVVCITKEANAGLRRNQTKKIALHCLPYDPKIMKKWMKFIFNEDPNSASKNLVLSSRHFTMDSFKNKAQFHAKFSETL